MKDVTSVMMASFLCGLKHFSGSSTHVRGSTRTGTKRKKGTTFWVVPFGYNTIMSLFKVTYSAIFRQQAHLEE